MNWVQRSQRIGIILRMMKFTNNDSYFIKHFYFNFCLAKIALLVQQLMDWLNASRKVRATKDKNSI